MFLGHTPDWWSSVSALGTWAAVIVSLALGLSAQFNNLHERRLNRRTVLTRASKPLTQLQVICRTVIRAQSKRSAGNSDIRIIASSILNEVANLRPILDASQSLKKEELIAFLNIMFRLDYDYSNIPLEYETAKQTLPYIEMLLAKAGVETNYGPAETDESLDELISSGRIVQ